ncbi:Ferroportin1-domain-containing protein [Nemania sp. FL0916]|nr:Ferroportin1-domain-containing protein [Nemania sp. FL0916]
MDSDDEMITARRYSDEAPTVRSGLTRAQAFNLYLSHAFSTWNARGYEFAAILFTAAAYPNTLVAAALRMIIIYIAMIVFSSSVGQWVERSPNRLRTLLSTICCNRASVILGSFFWLLILSQENLLAAETPTAVPSRFVLPRNDILKGVIFAVAVAFGIIERLSASGNLISMERDWVVTVAGPTGHPYDLTNLNAVMRRIDLVCKLISPILISIVISATGSVRIGVLYTEFTSLICIPIELISAKLVWSGSPALQAPKPVPAPEPAQRPNSGGEESGIRSMSAWPGRIRQYFKGLEMYFTSPVWMPSLALAILHFNMLTWRATFITYLINIGYSLNVITIARAIGSVFEISSTVITPRGIVYLGKTRRQGQGPVPDNESEASLLHEEAAQGDLTSDAQTAIGLQRLGLWGLSSQLINTIPIVLVLWSISPSTSQTNDPLPQPALTPTHSILLFAFLSFSRLGVWIYDLTTQQLTQTFVPATQRSRFAGVEASVVNVFEVLGAGAAIAFPDVAQFRYLALASLAAVGVSWALYAAWVRERRAHLVHWGKLAGAGVCGRG